MSSHFGVPNHWLVVKDSQCSPSLWPSSLPYQTCIWVTIIHWLKMNSSSGFGWIYHPLSCHDSDSTVYVTMFSICLVYACAIFTVHRYTDIPWDSNSCPLIVKHFVLLCHFLLGTISVSTFLLGWHGCSIAGVCMFGRDSFLADFSCMKIPTE